MPERIAEEIGFCLMYEARGTCTGAGGRKLRRVCVWCPNYRRKEKPKEKEEGKNAGG